MRKNRVITAVLVVAVAMVVLAGGLVASNMGFKLNYSLKGAQGGVSQSGNNTLSLPYNRQQGIDTAQDLFVDILAAGTVQNLQNFLPATDSFQIYSFASPNFGLSAGVGVFAKMGAGGADYIVVGSHDPSASVALSAAGGGSQSGNNLYAPPYHGTAATAKDLFIEIGTGVTQNVQRFLTLTDSVQVYSFASPDFPIVPGEAYFVKMGSSKNHTPSHY